MFDQSSKHESFRASAFSGEALTGSRGKDPLNPLKLNKSSRALRATGDSRSNPFRINSSSYKRSERVGDDEGKDYYRFNLSGRREIEISVENREFFLGPSLDFRLLNNRGSKIKSREVNGGRTEEIERTLGKGTYYIKVESGGESVPYRLKFKSKSD